MKTLNSDLAIAEILGYPTGGYQPSVRCQLTSKDGATTYDYTFDPTVNTNRLLHCVQNESPADDSGVILLRNNDRLVPANLVGYYVDMGWGANTSSGLKNTAAHGAVTPRQWVMGQNDISGAPKAQKPDIYSALEMGGVWRAVLNSLPLRIGAAPYYRDNRDPEDSASITIAGLTGLTVYGCIEYAIETGLVAATGISFTLSALVQDDGLISTVIPYPSGGRAIIDVNPATPGTFMSYGEWINALLGLTKSFLRAKANLDFEIIYPQTSDAVNKTYYTAAASGEHPFYEVTDVKVGAQGSGVALPNHIEVIADSNPLGDPPILADVMGEYYDSDHWTTVADGSFVIGTIYRILTVAGTNFTTIGAGSNNIGTIFTATGADGGGSGTAVTYTGAFMPVDSTYYLSSVLTAAAAANEAVVIYQKLKAGTTGAMVRVPMDAALELYDRIQIDDTRGV